jgi:uncharacterized protein YbaA (DUF1428 family)
MRSDSSHWSSDQRSLSWIVYESREQRDAINAKVMADPQIQATMSASPFDGKRLIYGGFETFLEL